MTFSELALAPSLLASLPATITTPTRIQQLAIPAILGSRDVLALAQTGSGKTLAFGLPLLQQLDATQPQVQGLVLVPTRELAAQIAGALHAGASALGLSVVMLCGGVDPAMTTRFVRELGLTEVHASGGKARTASGRVAEFGFAPASGKRTDLEEVRRLKAALVQA